jgi:hypothetical protein
VVVPPLLPRSKKLRTALLVAGSLVFVGVVALILVLSADSGSGNHPKAKAKPQQKQVVADAKKKSLTLVMGKVNVQNTGFPAAVNKHLQRSVMAATQRYFDDAIQAPLQKGKIDNAYGSVFDPSIAKLAVRRDRATLAEAATGPIRSPIRIASSRVRIDGLGDPAGKIMLVAASFNLEINAGTPNGKLSINRHTELTFAKESGIWRVTAYRVTVKRSVGKKTTSNTAHSGPGTTS